MSESKVVFYKIRRNSDGLFSNGGMRPSFNKSGKVWHNKGALSNHLGLVMQMGKVYADCEIVQLEMVPTDTINITEYVAGIADRREKRKN